MHGRAFGGNYNQHRPVNQPTDLSTHWPTNQHKEIRDHEKVRLPIFSVYFKQYMYICLSLCLSFSYQDFIFTYIFVWIHQIWTTIVCNVIPIKSCPKKKRLNKFFYSLFYSSFRLLSIVCISDFYLFPVALFLKPCLWWAPILCPISWGITFWLQAPAFTLKNRPLLK